VPETLEAAAEQVMETGALVGALELVGLHPQTLEAAAAAATVQAATAALAICESLGSRTIKQVT
jgi:hypothetical protein